MRIELDDHTLALRKPLVAIVPRASKFEVPHEGRKLIAHQEVFIQYTVRGVVSNGVGWWVRGLVGRCME